MKLVVMTKSTFFVEEDKILTALFDEGMERLHLYKPQSLPIYTERLLSLIPDHYYKQISIHENFYLNREYDLGGIHLDNQHEEVPQGIKGRVSRTCEDLSLLKEMKKNANYVFLRRVFDEPNNNEKKATFTRQQLEEAADKGWIDKKVYALGGVTTDNIKAAKELGFGGVVICSDLWNKFDVHNETDYKTLLTHFKKIRNIAD